MSDIQLFRTWIERRRGGWEVMASMVDNPDHVFPAMGDRDGGSRFRLKANAVALEHVLVEAYPNGIDRSDPVAFAQIHDACTALHAVEERPKPSATVRVLPVLFRAERSGVFKGDVTAVFPTQCADYAGREMTCYAHIGQHSGCSLDWYRDTRPARPAEYADLLAELRRIYERDGDVVLQVRLRITDAMREELRASARAAQQTVATIRGARPGRRPPPLSDTESR